MIHTVLGPIPASELGRVDMHEHVQADAAGLSRPGFEPTPEHDAITMADLGYLRWNMLGMPDNLRLDDPDVAVAELAALAAAGFSSVVDNTALGLGPDHAALPELSRRSGVAIVVAYGAYVPAVLPAWVAELDEAALEEHLVGALDDHLPGVEFRAGTLGILGTTGIVTDEERMRLRASGRAAARTGAAVSVRLDQDHRAGLDVVHLFDSVGVPADRVIFTNADEYMDASYWADLSASGAVLEMCFGTEHSHLGRLVNPSDLERLDFFAARLVEQAETRYVVGGSLWTKAQLTPYGGPGLGHLGRRIVPELLRRGIPQSRIDAMLVTEPARLLDRP